MADPPGCCHPCATCLLCLYSCQWITTKKEKRKGLRTTKVIPRVALSWGWPAPAWVAGVGKGSGWGAQPRHWAADTLPLVLSPKRAGVLPGTLSVQGLP